MTTFRTAKSPRTPAPTSPSPDRAYYPALDGIRAVAFLMVFATHYLQMPWGWTGVNIFFVLSGFLITGILYDARGDQHRVRNFYVRRTLRIFPLYYGIMLLLVAVYPVFHWDWNWKWLIWPAYLGNFARYFSARGPAYAMLEFAQPLSRTFPRVQLALGHFWSLCVEEQFYLLWPWAVFGVKGTSPRRALLWICSAAVLILPLLRVAASHTLPRSTVDAAALITATPLPFDALLLGALVALLLRGPLAGRVLPVARIVFAIIATAFLLWLVRHPGARSFAEPYPYPAWIFTWGLSFIDILSACVLVMALHPRSLTFRLFHLRPLRWLGRISYGAYVFHDILHSQFVRLAQHFTAHWKLPAAALALASTLLLAWASFRWFEGPFIRLKDRLTRRAALAEHGAPEILPEPVQQVA